MKKETVTRKWWAVEDNLSPTPRLASEVMRHRENAIRERDEYYPGCNIVPVTISYKPSGKRFRTNRSSKAT